MAVDPLRAAGLALALLLAMPACVTVTYQDQQVDRPPPERATALLAVGESDLGQCLELLGAPTQVRHDELGDEMELRWEWSRVTGWGLGVTLPVGQDWSPSVNYGRRGESPDYLRLFFDRDGRLTRLSRG